MARIRSIKPEFFMHDGLAELPPLHRLLFIGIWTQADREGRLEDRPARIKAAVLPYDEADVDAMLWNLAEHRERFVVRYEASGVRYLQVTGFAAHQQPHIKEVASKIPGLQAGTVRERCKPVKPESGPDGTAPDQNPRRGAEGSIEGAVQGAGASREQEGRGTEARAREASDHAPGGAAADPIVEYTPEMLEAVELCRAHPYLGEMLDPAVTLTELRAAYPSLPLVETVRRSRAALTPERIARQRQKLGPASRFLTAFFDIAERERIAAERAPTGMVRPAQHAADRTMDAIEEAFGVKP